MRQYTYPKGFTLIELMVVVAIISILAMIAIPNYRTYVLQTKVAEMMSSINMLKEIATQNLIQYNDCYNTKAGDQGDHWTQPPEYVNSPTTATIWFLWHYKSYYNVSGNCAVIVTANPAAFGGNVGDYGGHGYWDLFYVYEPSTYQGSAQVQNITWRCYYDFHGYADVQAKILPLLPVDCKFRASAGV
jgi:prepilin-type N-terminal cleavage/methylation domain-containing protein